MTQDNLNRLTQLVRQDAGEDTNFYMIQLIEAFGAEDLKSQRRLNEIFSRTLDAIDIINDVIRTGQSYTTRGMNPQTGEQQSVEINTENAPDMIDQNLWTLVTISAIAQLSEISISNNLANDRMLLNITEEVIPKYTNDVLTSLGISRTASEEPAAEEPTAEPTAEPAAEPAAEEPKDFPQPGENDYTLRIVERNYIRSNDEEIEEGLENFKSLYGVDLMNKKTDIDSRKTLTDISRALNEPNLLFTASLFVGGPTFEELKMQTKKIKLLIELTKFASENSLENIKFFPTFFYLISFEDIVEIQNHSQTYITALLFVAHTMNKSAQLVNELNLRISNQDINKIYIDYIDKIIKSYPNQTAEQIFSNSNNLTLVRDLPKVRNDLDRRISYNLKIAEFSKSEPIVNQNQINNELDVTLRGF